jgi:hypothetical protein
MKLFKISIIISFLLIPTAAFAWGPLTHMYLGNELYSLGSLLPASLFEIIRRYKKDFLYGNLMADIVVGKKYLPDNKNSHSWDFAFDLLKGVETKQQKAFVYGYMSHLAADTVAHNAYIVDKKNFGHSVMEMKADSIIDKKYWFQAISIDRKIQMRNDLFLENSIDRFIFSYKTNKRILKGTVYLSLLYRKRINDFIDKNLITSLPVRETIEKLQQESIDKIIDLFQNWKNSDVIKVNPSGNGRKKGLLMKELEPLFLRQYKSRRLL